CEQLIDRFFHLEKGNTVRGKNGKRKNTLHSPLNQADGSLWEVCFLLTGNMLYSVYESCVDVDY
uniref:Uncharacterized protein n=1 Tax=Megaselia scalaris TaxID=36166 RepID=T1GS91_MEGSC